MRVMILKRMVTLVGMNTNLANFWGWVANFGGRFGYFYFSARVGGGGGVRGARKGGVGFLLKIPGGGGLLGERGGGRGAGRLSAGNGGGVGLNIFFRGRNAHFCQKSFRNPNPYSSRRKCWYTSNLYRHMPPICNTVPCWLLSLEERVTPQHAFYLHCTMPPICTALRLPFVPAALLRKCQRLVVRKVPELGPPGLHS